MSAQKIRTTNPEYSNPGNSNNKTIKFERNQTQKIDRNQTQKFRTKSNIDNSKAKPQNRIRFGGMIVVVEVGACGDRFGACGG